MLEKKIKKFRSRSIKNKVPESVLYLNEVTERNLSQFRKKIDRAQLKTVYWMPQCGVHTTAGGAAQEDLVLQTVKLGDVVTATLKKKGAVPVTLDTVEALDGKIRFTFSADPSTDHEVSFIVGRKSV